MQNIKLIFKGIIIGLGKIIPGVSGSMLAFSLGVYEKAINAITNFKSDLKNNILFLSYLGIGVVIAILLFSNILIYLLNNYYDLTIILFIGLIGGTIPSVLKKVTLKKKRNLLFFFLALFIVYLIGKLQISKPFMPKHSILNYLYIIFLGIIDATTMIIPGISGTATFMMLNAYDFVLKIFSNPFKNIGVTILFFSGILIGIILISKLISYLLKKKKEELYLLIIGFSLSSLIYLFLQLLPKLILAHSLYYLLLFIVGLVISYKMEM